MTKRDTHGSTRNKPDTMGMSRGFSSYAFRPNNYRRCWAFSKRVDTGSLIGGGAVSGKGVYVWSSMDVTLMAGPRKLIAVWRPGGRWYEARGSVDVVNARIRDVELGIMRELDRVAGGFLRENNLLAGAPVWVRKEFALKGEEFLDKLPEDLIIHDTVFKKVYGDVPEFTSYAGGDAGAYAKNYIKNRAVEDVAPEIIRAFNAAISIRDEPLLWAVNTLKGENDKSLQRMNEVGLLIPKQYRPELFDWWLDWAHR